MPFTVFVNCRTSGYSLQWRHNGRDGVSNHQSYDCLLNRSFRRRSKKTSKLHVTGLCEGNSQVIGEFPAQMTSNAENISIWWRHHECKPTYLTVGRVANNAHEMITIIRLPQWPWSDLINYSKCITWLDWLRLDVIIVSRQNTTMSFMIYCV